MRNVVEVISIDKVTTGLNIIKKLSKTEYVNTETGEVHQYNLAENKSESIASLKKTFRRTRDLINNNFEGKPNELHITLTYRQREDMSQEPIPMTDTNRLYRDFQTFWQRFKRKYGDDIDYLSIVEPQESGSWHCHVLVRFNKEERVFIPNNDIAAIWKQGNTTTRATDKTDNMGAYITAYLTDVELTPENAGQAIGKEVKFVEVDGQEKKYIKGARVHFYPTGMNICRHSKGIIPPDVEEMTYKKAKKIVRDATPNYSSTVTITDDDAILNRITYEHYNLKR